MTVDIIVADCMDFLRTLPPETFDCAVLDPPYGETHLRWDRWPEGWPSEVRRVLKPSGSMWVFGSQKMFLNHIGDFNGWKFAQDIIWEKHNGSGLHHDRFRRVHEHALQFYGADTSWAGVYRKPQYTNDAKARVVRKKSRPAHWHGAQTGTVYQSQDGGPRLQRSVIFARSEHRRGVHPTQKPLDIVEPLLRYSCPPGGTVLDCFAGSGTVGVAALRHGMNATLVEVDPEIAEIARIRLRTVPA